jgi:hypothetical protein
MRKLILTLIAMLLSIAAAFPAPRASALRTRLSSEQAPGEIIIRLKQRPADSLSAGHAEEYLTAARRLARTTAAARELAHAEPLVSAEQAAPVRQLVERRGLDRSFVLKLSPGTRIDSVISELQASGEVGGGGG